MEILAYVCAFCTEGDVKIEKSDQKQDPPTFGPVVMATALNK